MKGGRRVASCRDVGRLCRAGGTAPHCRTTTLLPLALPPRCPQRQDVRLRCTQHTMDVLAPLLEPQAPPGGRAQPAGGEPAGGDLPSEAANAASNLCYEPANCSMLLKAQGVGRLLRLLSASGAGAEAHANAAGALQTLSFQPDGRAALLKAGGAATVLQRLASSGSSSSGGEGEVGTGAGAGESKLQQRLVGALHNLSSSAEGVQAIWQQGGIPAIARLLASQHPGVAAAAAGAVQNMSLEAQARGDVRAQPGALAALAGLLIGPDTQVKLNSLWRAPCPGPGMHRHTRTAPHPKALPSAGAGGGVRRRRPRQPGGRCGGGRRWLGRRRLH